MFKIMFQNRSNNNFIFYFRLPKIKTWVDENNPGDLILPFSASLELQHSSLPTKEEKDKFLSEKDTQSALPRIIVAGYQTLQLMYFFTCGPDEVRAWTIRVFDMIHL
jgi:obg-like ATPase 1